MTHYVGGPKRFHNYDVS